jgi:hypothetical protein
MNSKKGATSILFSIIFIAITILFGSRYPTSNQTTVSNNSSISNSSSSSSVANNSNSDLWAIFDKINEALKNKNIQEYNSYSYKPVPSDQVAQFSQMAPALVANFNKADFVNKWQDDKQAIYSTNLQKETDAIAWGYGGKEMVMFVKGKDGSWKVLSIALETGGASISKKGAPGMTDAQAEQELQKMMLDSDKDGLTDMDETCGESVEMPVQNCVKTDPNKRDSKGDGWWDGIRKAMNAD